MSKRDLKENTNLSAVSDNFQSMIDLKRAFFRKVTRRFLINSYASFNCELDSVVYNERDIYLQLFQFRGKNRVTSRADLSRSSNFAWTN